MKKLKNIPYLSPSVLDFLSRELGSSDVTSIYQEIEDIVSQHVLLKLKEHKNKSRVIQNDLNKEHVPAVEGLAPEVIEKLPSWVKSELHNAMLLGSSRSVIQVSDGRKYHINNALNSLSGGEWTYFLNSVLSTRYPSSGPESYAHHIRKIHPSPKPPQLMRDIIKFFTKENELVFDYFMGVGGSLLGASLCGRDSIGIDLNAHYIDVYKEAASSLGLRLGETVCGDSLAILSEPETLSSIFKGRKASLILLDPPYGDMMSRPKTGEAAKRGEDTSPTPFNTSSHDLGNMVQEDFLAKFKESIFLSSSVLKEGGHFVVFIKDLQPKGKQLNLLHVDLINLMNSFDNLQYLGTKIWADLGVNLYPYGYPYAYVSNQIHQYILIFKKK